MAFPKRGTTVPSLTEWQMSYRGYSWGPRTNLEMKGLEGIDLPTVRSGDAGRPRDHGLFRGLDVMGGREVTVKGQLHNNVTGKTFQECWNELAAATVPGGAVEEPLFLNLPGFGTLATLARIRKRNMPVDIQFTLGNLADVQMLFASSDPRWYSPTQGESVNPPNLSRGIKFNFGFELSFGGGSLAGALSLTNNGNIETRPLLIVEGPCTNPSITNLTTPGAPSLTFTMTIPSGAKLEIDTDLHTATYYIAGATQGVSRMSAIAQGSQWFTLEPGTSTLQFLAANQEGKLEVQFASAYLI